MTLPSLTSSVIFLSSFFTGFTVFSWVRAVRPASCAAAPPATPGHPYFLQTAWAENNINGEANFDIDDDKNKGQADLFGYVELTKIMKFRQEIHQAILDGTLETNKEAFDFALNQGHLPSHAADEIKLMKKEKLISSKTKLISYKGRSPLVTYDKVYKDKIILHYTRCAQRK